MRCVTENCRQNPPATDSPAQDWLALSGKGLIDPAANPFKRLDKGMFALELRLPMPSAPMLINHQSHEGMSRSFALFYDAAMGLSLTLRAGTAVVRHVLPGPFALQGDTARLTYHFDCAQNRWSLRLDALHAQMPAYQAAGHGTLPLAHRDAEAICQSAICAPAVLWFGFSRSANLPKTAPWIGPRTAVDTSLGPVQAGRLAAGDIIMTQDHGPVMLRNVQQLQLPARGSFAPILLRGPYYDRRGDVLVSADQRIVLTCDAAEYMFGSESVLVAARDVVDGRTALAEDRRTITAAVCLDLGYDALIGGEDAGHLTLALGGNGQCHDAPLPVLTSFETAALLRMMGRIVAKVA